MYVRSFESMSTRRLDRMVNDFVERPEVEVRQLHVAMSFGSRMITVEYEARGEHAPR